MGTIAKIQQMYIGSRETASTCHGLNSQQTVLVKPKVTSKVDKSQVKPIAVLRRTPRKNSQSQNSSSHASKTGKDLKHWNALERRLTAPKNPEEIFRQKLRGAVYDALEVLNVKQGHSLFKPCFKKLFEIVKIYSSDIPRTGPGAKKILAKVAKYHAEQVIKLEKALHSQ